MSNSTRLQRQLFSWPKYVHERLLQWAQREHAVSAALIAQANLRPGMRVLVTSANPTDLVIQVEQLHKNIAIAVLCEDMPAVKAKHTREYQADTATYFIQFDGFVLPFANAIFDRVFCHKLSHMPTERKAQLLRQVYRVMRPSGELHMADWVTRAEISMEMCYSSVQVSDRRRGNEEIEREILHNLIRGVGFVGTHETQTFGTFSGRLSLLKARKAI